MGDLMRKLHDDQRRLEECAETIPGLLVRHFDAPAVRSESEFRLMQINAEQRHLIEALQERNAVHAQEKAVMARRMADMEAELRTLRGGAIATAAGGQA